MQFAFIIGSLTAAVVLLTVTLKNQLEDDELVGLSFLVLILVVIFVGLSLALTTGRLFNNEGGFLLKHAREWRQIKQDASEHVYSYEKTIDGTLENVSIVVSNVSKETKQNILRSLKDSDKILKLTAKENAKTEKEKAKQNEKQIKKEFKKDKPQLKRRLEENELALVQTLQTSEKQLKDGLEANRQDRRKLSGKWLEEPAGVFTAAKETRIYTVTPSSNAALADVSIKPYGFLYGMVDGFAIPIQGIGGIFISSWHPYKVNNNGISYLIGFILGVGILTVLVVGLLYAFHEKRTRLKWEAKWAAMTIPEKVDYITGQYQAAQKEKDHKLQISRDEYNSLKNNYGKSPEGLLKAFNELPEEGALSNFFGNLFTAGEHNADKVKEHYYQLTEIYQYYQTRYMLSLYEVEIADTAYKYEREKAALYINQMKEIFDKFNYKQKELFDQVKKMGLRQEQFKGPDVRELLKSIERFNTDYNIKAEASWDKTMKFAGGVLEETSKFIDKKTKKGMQKLSDEDMVVAGIGTVIGLGAIAAEGVGQFLGNMERNKEVVATFKEGEAELRNAITNLEVNRSKAKDFIKRAREINSYLEDSMQRYTRMFEEVNAMLYPPGNAEKSKEVHLKREEEGKSFFTDEEVDRVFALYDYGKIMATVVDAEF
jgi:hypothetical protein